jgi:hypothetical protein
MGHTIMVPPAQSDPSPPQVPYPTAFTRTKEFLKVLLKPLCEAQHEFIMSIGVKRAMKEMVHQLEMYARHEGPFTSPLRSDTLSWWRTLSESCDANVLAVCFVCHCWYQNLAYSRCQFLAIRIYSATVNSMADERTVSNFTWFNSSLRNRQNVSTLT